MFLRQLVLDCDRKIQRQKNRIRAEEKVIVSSPIKLTEENTKRLTEIQEETDKLANEAQKVGMEGDTTRATEIFVQINALGQERQRIKAGPEIKLNANERTLVVCNISGNYMSTTDSADRMAAHFNGKQYQGWKKVRDIVKELGGKNLKPGTRQAGRNNRPTSYRRTSYGGGGGRGDGGRGMGRGSRSGGGERRGGRDNGSYGSGYGGGNSGGSYGYGRGSGKITGSNRDPIKNMRSFGKSK